MFLCTDIQELYKVASPNEISIVLCSYNHLIPPVNKCLYFVIQLWTICHGLMVGFCMRDWIFLANSVKYMAAIYLERFSIGYCHLSKVKLLIIVIISLTVSIISRISFTPFFHSDCLASSSVSISFCTIFLMARCWPVK